MKQLNKETERAKQMIQNYRMYYNSNSKRHLYDLYKNPSWNKVNAHQWCEDLKEKYEGYNGIVLGGNSSYFSYGFLFDRITENEKITYLCYVTYANTYEIEYKRVTL